AFNGIVATLRDAKTSQTAGAFAVSINRGDGSTSAGVVGSGADATHYDVTGSHTYAEAGTYSVTVQASDADGETASATGTATVSDGLTGDVTPITAFANIVFTGIVATFTDGNSLAESTDFEATLDWGDLSNQAIGTVTRLAPGSFQVTGTHTYSAASSYLLYVSVHDVNGLTLVKTGRATVQIALPAVMARPIQAVEGVGFTGVVVSFSDQDATLTAGNFTASVQWGDGHTSSGTVSSSGS